MKKIIVFASFALFFLFAPVTFAYYPTEKIINGGFENTPLGTGWYQSYGSAIGSHGGGWHSGSYGAKLGINYTTEYIYQDVDIPRCYKCRSSILVSLVFIRIFEWI